MPVMSTSIRKLCLICDAVSLDAALVAFLMIASAVNAVILYSYL
ncbi:MAG: hypothetical protein JWQ82_1694 [Tardiphaga sp.]|nr:hypothetical protein [Tardiphaga sp.]MDB5522097.1 hypothetical protein [Tardiphaga sp.]